MAPAISTSIDSEYILDLRNRIAIDLKNANFDSVITKSRTLIEEVLIYIIEHNNCSPDTSGNINKLYGQCKGLLNMKQSSANDKRINEILSGLEKIISGISSLRNIGSDAHGVGSSRINIRQHEAILISNSAMAFCEYILSVYQSQVNPF